MSAIANPAIVEKRVATSASGRAARLPCFTSLGSRASESTRRPPPQTMAGRRCNPSIISAMLKSPASDACPDALSSADTIIAQPSIAYSSQGERRKRRAARMVSRARTAAMRSTQAWPKCVRSTTVGSAAKPSVIGEPLISAERTKRPRVLLARSATAATASKRRRAGTAPSRFGVPSPRSGATQSRQTSTPMQKARETSSSHSGVARASRLASVSITSP